MAAKTGNTPSGTHLLFEPCFSGVTAFTEAKRRTYRLPGLLPPHVESLAEQQRCTCEALQERDSDLQKYRLLRKLLHVGAISAGRLEEKFWTPAYTEMAH